MGDVTEQRGTVDGLDAHWWEAPAPSGRAPVLYCHGVPTAGWEWKEFLARTGGFAPDMPGFGESSKVAAFDHTIDGYASWLERFADDRGLDRFSLLVHDWGSVGLAFAQRFPERVERLALVNPLPFLPGYRWHTIARQWRRPLIGEMVMGFTFKRTARMLLNRSNREPIPEAFAEDVWRHFDHGTQRAILKRYRAAPPAALAAAGTDLGLLESPALVVWGARDPYIPAEFAQAYADALGGETTVRVVEDAGHWPWLDEPGLVREITGFLSS